MSSMSQTLWGFFPSKFPVVFLYEDKDRMIENFKVKSKFRFVWENGQAEKANTWRR